MFLKSLVPSEPEKKQLQDGTSKKKSNLTIGYPTKYQHYSICDLRCLAKTSCYSMMSMETDLWGKKRS